MTKKKHCIIIIYIKDFGRWLQCHRPLNKTLIPKVLSQWIPHNATENHHNITVSGNKILPDWGFGCVYTVVVVNCTFPFAVGHDGAGGRLLLHSSTSAGPDWAMNLEICDICNHDPVQAKDVVKGIKKHLGSKNPKVQLLALTLLETIVKNCGDFFHMHVTERDLLHDMVKIVKKKPDFHVKEKILILIDTWQEAFGGARARYPQYYAAYHDLLRLGANFPPRSERAAPVLTPSQSQPITSFPHNLQNPENENGHGTGMPSAETEF